MWPTRQSLLVRSCTLKRLPTMRDSTSLACRLHRFLRGHVRRVSNNPGSRAGNVLFSTSTLSPTLKSTLFYVIFALSLVGRPVGAKLFGHYGDKLGRPRVTNISMGGFAVVTLLIGLLPGYETSGMGSIVMLVLLRFIDGVFLWRRIYWRQSFGDGVCP
jgi:MFS family permease